MGRPPLRGEKAAPLFAMRFPEELAALVDAYAEREGERQNKILTRSEAVRLLIELGLKADTAVHRAKR